MKNAKNFNALEIKNTHPKKVFLDFKLNTNPAKKITVIK